MTYSYTGGGGTLTFTCNDALFPSDVRTSVCIEGQWTPVPQEECIGMAYNYG